MKKADLIQQIQSENNKFTQSEVKSVLSSFQKLVLKALKSDKEVVVLDLGKLKIARRNERQGVNPRDPKGPKVTIPARDVPQLRPSKKLKDFVAGESSVDSFDY